MSAPPQRPMAGRPPGQATSIKAEMATVMANLANLFAMDRDGKLSPNQVVQLIAAQARQITLRTTLKRQPNPLNSLPPHLDPSVASAGNPAIVSKELFENSIRFAEQEAHRVLNAVIPMPELKKLLDVHQEKRNEELSSDATLRHRFHTSVLWYTKGGADAWVMGPRGATHVPPPPQTASGANTPRPPPATAAGGPSAVRPTATQPSTSTTSSPAPSKTNTPGVANVPTNVPNSNAAAPPRPAEAAKGAPPSVRPPPPTTSTTATQQPQAPETKPEQDAKPAVDPSAASAPAPPAGPSTSAGASGSTNAPTSTAPPVRAPPPAPPAPVVPVEPEPMRRRRKVREWLHDEGPGMEFESGTIEILSEVLDAFVAEAARGAIKLAQHRKADKVGVKDMAFFLDNTYGITVPGFNAQVPERVHAAPEGKRRSVAPRAARLAKPKEDE